MENIGILFNNLTKHYNSSYIAHPNANCPAYWQRPIAGHKGAYARRA